MKYKDEEWLRERWLAYWQLENHDRPLMSVYAPRKNSEPIQIKVPQTLEEQWMNLEYIVDSAKKAMAHTYYGGEAFPVINPNLGPDLLGAICGCDIGFGKDTSWAIHTVQQWKACAPITFDAENKWWRRIKEMTQYVLDESMGEYLVGITDLHPGLDGLVSLRGPEALCMDLIDEPEEVCKRNMEVLEVYKKVFAGLSQVIGKKQQGSTNWMGIWHPEHDWYVTSCDFSCLISGENFEQFVIPGLMGELDYLPASIYHLDGPGALRHLDRLLEIEQLKGIQWVYGAGQPSARFWLPVLQKIQQKKKLIQIHCEKEDIRDICEALAPEGVHITCNASSEVEAKELIKQVERIYCMEK